MTKLELEPGGKVEISADGVKVSVKISPSGHLQLEADKEDFAFTTYQTGSMGNIELTVFRKGETCSKPTD